MIELGLQRISSLLADTPLPWRAIHVAGTNGKGSICAYVSSMLDVYNKSRWRQRRGQSALRHARFTSPHLVDRWDCITINQEVVPFKLFNEVETRVLARDKRLQIRASEFEILTATAFEIFTQERIDVGVVEVGMGGRLDATNVIGQSVAWNRSDGGSAALARPRPLVCAIAKIGLDHQAFLGTTLEAIATEKAGIIKPDSTIIYDTSNASEVCGVIESIAKQVDGNVLNSISSKGEDVIGETTTPSTLDASLDLPDHTKQNLRIALLSTWSALEQLGRLPANKQEVDEDAKADIDAVLAEMRCVPQHTIYPGRLQRLSIEKLTGRRHDILLDGAHNPQSAEVLAAEIEHRYRTARKVVWLLAITSTKDCSEMLRILVRPGDSVYAVEFGPVDGMPWVRPTPAEGVAAAAHEILHSRVAHACGNDLPMALKLSSEEAGEGPLCVAGSLYLVSDVLKLLRETSQ